MDHFPSSGSCLGSRPGERGCLECSRAGDRRGRLGRSRRELALQAGARLWKWDVNEGFLWGRGVGGGSEPAPQVQHASQWVGTQCRHFFSPFALLLSGNYPTDSFTLPANAWLKPAKHPLALKFQNLQGYAGNREPAKKEKKKLSATEQPELPMNTKEFFMA